MNYHITMQSSNVKTGPMPVTTSTNETCPSACPFKDNGCYAQYGPLKMHWDKVSNGSRGMDWLEFIDAIRSIKRGQLWRHNQAGDLPGNGNRINSRMMMDLVEANKGKRGYTYTHKPLTDANIKLIEHANANGFTVNVSTNNINELDNARSKTKSSPLVTVLPLNSPKIQKTSQGMTVLKCPAQTTDISCFECGLCQNASRSFAIGFEVHGTGKSKLNKELV